VTQEAAAGRFICQYPVGQYRVVDGHRDEQGGGPLCARGYDRGGGGDLPGPGPGRSADRPFRSYFVRFKLRSIIKTALTLVLSVRGSPVIYLNYHNHEFALQKGEDCPIFTYTIGIEWVLLADSLYLLQEGFRIRSILQGENFIFNMPGNFALKALQILLCLV